MSLILFQGEAPAVDVLFDTPEEAVQWLREQLAHQGLALEHVDYFHAPDTGHGRLAAFCRAKGRQRQALEGLELRHFRAYYIAKQTPGTLTVTTHDKEKNDQGHGPGAGPGF